MKLFAKVSEVSVGAKLKADGGFTCLDELEVTRDNVQSLDELLASLRIHHPEATSFVFAFSV